MNSKSSKKSSFEVIGTLGVGGMATVSLALWSDGDGQPPRNVAVKRLHPDLAALPESRFILEDEARLGACIRHPNVVRVIDLVNEDALIMEWVEGVDLARLSRVAALSGRRIPADVAAAIARDVLAGLEAAHESRCDESGIALAIVHRDVSPQNVLIGFDGVARVTDFGVATANGSRSERHQPSETASITGKLRYIAPEQLSGTSDRRSDIYSVGVVLWELLTGSTMRAGHGIELLVEVLCPHPPSAPSSCVAAHEDDDDATPEAIDAIVLRALAACPDDRFATAAEMIASMANGSIRVASSARVAEVVRSLLGHEEGLLSPPPTPSSSSAKVSAIAATTQLVIESDSRCAA